MPAAQGFDRRRLGKALLSRFALVGIGATVLYGVLAMFLGHALPPVQASFTAYAIATAFSYLGHKFITFLSHGAHRAELPRFLVLSAVGFAIATALPALLTEGLAWPPSVAVLLTCALVPVINLVVLDRWVFARRRAPADQE